MLQVKSNKRSWDILILSMALLATSTWADRPEKAGQGRNKDSLEDSARGHPFKGNADSREALHGAYFEPRHRQAVREIYGPSIAQGKCPPGLAKKGNGCQAPGLAKQWVIGQPLPSDLVLYSLPFALHLRLGPPPAGYKYVRVANDILLIAIGTSIVLDAIENLGGL
jgi:hypothetical protein